MSPNITVVDARPAQNEHRHRGIGRYVLGALSATVRACPESVAILVHGDRPVPESLARVRRYTSRRPHAFRYHAGWAVDELLIPLAARRAAWGLFHATDPDAIPGHFVPTVATVYDLTPSRDPQLWQRMTPDQKIGYRRMLSNARRARAIVTISATVRADIAEWLEYPVERIAVCYPGIDVGEWQPPAGGSDANGTGPVLFVGAPGENKNIVGLLRALALMPAAPPLIVAGPWVHRHAKWLETRAAALGVRIQVEAFVTDVRLRELYSKAGVVVVPSRHEGFGLPVLEAMAMGTPVVVSAAPALVETGGDAVRVVPIDDAQVLAESIDTVLRDATLRGAMRARGLARAAQFSWDATGRALCDLYRSVR